MESHHWFSIASYTDETLTSAQRGQGRWKGTAAGTSRQREEQTGAIFSYLLFIVPISLPWAMRRQGQVRIAMPGTGPHSLPHCNVLYFQPGVSNSPFPELPKCALGLTVLSSG